MKLLITLVVVTALFASTAGTTAGEEITYLDAPKVVPGSTEDMQHPEFWIANIKGDPSRIIMTPEQILELNRKNKTKSYVYKDINGKEYTINNKNTTLVEDPLSIKTFPGDSVMILLERDRRFLKNGTFYDFRNRTWDEDMKNAVFEKIEYDSIPDTIVPQYGILVEYSFNRKLPTRKKAWREQNGWLNVFGNTSLDSGMPVAVLHTTKDRDWYYVRSEIHFGWVPAVNVAIGSAEDIGNYLQAPDFLVSLAYKVPVFSDRGRRNFLTDLYMGGRIKLLEQTSDGYYVLVPFRGPDGLFESVSGWVKPDAKISVGWQPYTQRNAIETFFSLLYRPWSSGDSYYERHCCGTVRGVLRTFGIIVKNTTTQQLHASDHVIAFPKETPNAKKHSLLEGLEPGITLIGSRAHVIMYLGEVDGRHFVIHSTGYDYKENESTVRMVRRVNVNDTELEGGSQVDTWTYICTVKP